MAVVAPPPVRIFQISGPFGLRMNFTTKVPGTLWFRYPRTETLESDAGDEGSPSPRTRRDRVDNDDQIYIDITAGNSVSRIACDFATVTDIVPLPDQQGEGACDEVKSTARSRSPSLVPTEVDETPEEIIEEIKQLGVKVRDFAYEKLPPHLEPVPEIFDEALGLGEYDQRLSTPLRMFPVPGKILWRLVNIGWVTMEEARKKWEPMDWKALADFEKRPRYPWKHRKIALPSPEDREWGRRERAFIVMAVDRARLQEEAEEFENSQQCQEPFAGRDVEEVPDSPTRGGKRHIVDDEAESEEESGGEDPDSSPPDAKRRRVGQPANGLRPPPESEQFPAPRRAYRIGAPSTATIGAVLNSNSTSTGRNATNLTTSNGAGPSSSHATPQETATGTASGSSNAGPIPPARRSNALRRHETLARIDI